MIDPLKLSQSTKNFFIKRDHQKENMKGKIIVVELIFSFFNISNKNNRTYYYV